MHGKVIWKPGIGEIVKAFRGIAPRPQLQCPLWTPNCNGQHADTRKVVTYSHKTQFFMKNEGQQKCLDKALLEYTFSSQSISKEFKFQSSLYKLVHTPTYVQKHLEVW